MTDQNQFAEYARSSAFRIDLTPAMITALLNVGLEGAYDHDRRLVLQPYWALKRRGLIDWIVVDDVKKGPKLTTAGVLVFDLLVEAGFAKDIPSIQFLSGNLS